MTNGNGSSSATDGEMSRKRQEYPLFSFHDFRVMQVDRLETSLPNGIFCGLTFQPPLGMSWKEMKLKNVETTNSKSKADF